MQTWSLSRAYLGRACVSPSSGFKFLLLLWSLVDVRELPGAPRPHALRALLHFFASADSCCLVTCTGELLDGRVKSSSCVGLSAPRIKLHASCQQTIVRRMVAQLLEP